MEKETVLKNIFDAIVDLDQTRLLEMVDVVIENDWDISEIVTGTMSPAMAEVGRQFQSGEKFLPELQLSAGVFQKAMTRFEPKILKQKGDIKVKGRVVIGTVKGDLHSIGKDLVTTMLKTNGFMVTDLGIDVDSARFIDEAQKQDARIIALSALLTTTMPAQRGVIEALSEQGLRNRFKVVIGGAPVDAGWAEQIGADAYGSSAPEAVRVMTELCL